jgi:transcription antitermination factor NusG
MSDEVWKPGDLVRVLAGPFAELLGTVEEVWAERSRLCVRLIVTGTVYRVEMHFTEVEAYDPDRRSRLHRRWRRGAPVRIVTGRFQQFVGVVQSADDHCQRVVVRLNGLRPEVAVEFDYSEIESA